MSGSLWLTGIQPFHQRLSARKLCGQFWWMALQRTVANCKLSTLCSWTSVRSGKNASATWSPGSLPLHVEVFFCWRDSPFVAEIPLCRLPNGCYHNTVMGRQKKIKINEKQQQFVFDKNILQPQWPFFLTWKSSPFCCLLVFTFQKAY